MVTIFLTATFFVSPNLVATKTEPDPPDPIIDNSPNNSSGFPVLQSSSICIESSSPEFEGALLIGDPMLGGLVLVDKLEFKEEGENSGIDFDGIGCELEIGIGLAAVVVVVVEEETIVDPVDVVNSFCGDPIDVFNSFDGDPTNSLAIS